MSLNFLAVGANRIIVHLTVKKWELNEVKYLFRKMAKNGIIEMLFMEDGAPNHWLF